MRYKLQPKLQIGSALIGGAVVVALAYLIEGQVDWVTAIAVAAGVAIGMGFAGSGSKSAKQRPSDGADDVGDSAGGDD